MYNNIIFDTFAYMKLCPIKHSLLVLLLEVIFCLPLYATNAVSSVDVHQDGNNIVITYQLAEQADITVSVSTNGGATYSSIKSVTGDVGPSVSAGAKSVVWNVLADYEKFCFDNVCFKVEGCPGFVDLGLPSGTRWAKKNEGGDEAFYTYDVAISKFGDNLPTRQQYDELIEQCTWTWTGKGYKVVGPNGNSIYLPAAGFRYCNGVVNYVGSNGYYWSSTANGSVYPYFLYFYSDKVYIYFNYLNSGRSVRLVMKTEVKQVEEIVDSRAYVDLGLSVKWATCNVGANSPEEYGDYFAWGETKPKDSYKWSTYKWCNGSKDKLTKYCKESYYGRVDNKTVLDLVDDAAHVNLGGAWRMPTKEEIRELKDNCTWTWTTQNGVNGYLVTSKKNDNSIFLPAAGYRSGSDLEYAGSYGRYWSSSLDTDHSDAYRLYFGSYNVDWFYYSRDFGQSVRPVLP